MKKLLTIITVLMSLITFSQEKIITGKITDEIGAPLFGVVVVIKGTSIGKTTDFDGNYSINAKVGDVLKFLYIGMNTIEVVIDNQTSINFQMKKSSEELDEVVIVGYGSVRKSDLTGSVSTVKAEELVKSGTVSLDQALAGRASGVVVTSNSGQLGSGASIKIRAVSSLNGSEPLYVIDGVPMDNTSAGGIGEADLESSAISPLSMINPSDIESVEILKDASSTAIYGSRGANGVVLVTTKTGKVGKGVVTVDQEFGVTEITRFIDVLSANDFVILDEEAYRNDGNLIPRNESRLDSARAGNLQNNDWQRTIIRLGKTSSTSVNFSGGNEDVRYLVSTNYLDAEGIVDQTDYQRISTRVNLTGNLSEKLKIRTGINYSYVTSNQRAINAGTNSIRGASNAISRALRSNPTTGLLADDEDEGIELYTPQTALSANTYTNLLTQFVGSLSAEYNFTDALSFKTDFSFQNRNTAQRYYQLNILPRNIAEGGRARTGDIRRTKYTYTNTVNYKQKFGKDRVNAVLGQSIEGTESEGVYVSNFGFANDLLTYFDPGSATFNDPDRITYSETKLASFFGRVNYTFNRKYLFTLTGRFDGASKFAANNKWAFFPAAAFAYKLSSEKFMRKIKAIKELKLRVSYGTSGNQAIRPYESLGRYVSDLTPFDEQTTTIYYADQLRNDDLTWETTTQLDLGLDLNLYNNKIKASFDYYNKITDDLLFTGNKIPVQTGQTSFTQNFGSLVTNGFEASLNLNLFENDKFSWSINANMATGKTKIKDMASDNLFSGWNPGFISGGTQRLIIGEEVGTFFGYQRQGIAQFDDFQEFQGLTNQERIDKYNADPSAIYTFVNGYNGGLPISDLDNGLVGAQSRPGDQLYKDDDSDGSITGDDRTIIGQAQPDLTFGINNTFSFGNIDFSFFIDSQIGKDIANIENIRLLGFSEKQSLNVKLDRWTPENPSTIWPRVSGLNDNSEINVFSDRFVEDASFVRLQNITLGYNFDSELMGKLNLSSLRIYVSATNLYTWTDYTGFSPDVSARGSSATNLGHDNSSYPQGRLIRMGLNLRF